MTMIERIREYWRKKKLEEEQMVDVQASYHVSHMVYCPSVAYVKGLEEYQNPSYRMVADNDQTIC